MPFLVLFALLFDDRPTDRAPVGWTLVLASSHELLDDGGSDLLQHVSAGEGLQDDSDEDGLPYGPGRSIDGNGPPSEPIDFSQSPLHPLYWNRHRPLRGPPAI